MIKIFGTNETESDLLYKNGDVIVQASKAVMHKYENGDFSLDLEAPLEYQAYFQQNRIVVIDLPSGMGGAECFRIKNVTKTKSKCQCKCMHISYDLQGLTPRFKTVNPALGGNYTYYTLLNWIESASHSDSPLFIPSFWGWNYDYIVDDYTVSGEDDFDDYLMSFKAGKSVWDTLQEYINKYGGYLYRNMYHIGISRNRITRDNGFTLRYGNNIKTIEKSEDWSSVATHLIAENDSMCYNYTSDVQYPYTYAKYIKFKSYLNPTRYSESDYHTALRLELDSQAETYLANNALPHINYTLDAYVERQNEYSFEINDIGDRVDVYDEDLDIDITAYVLGFDYDVLTESFLKVEFGNYAKTMRGYNDVINERISNMGEETTLKAYPVGSIIQNTGNNPTSDGIKGKWVQVSSSGGVYSWQRKE